MWELMTGGSVFAGVRGTREFELQVERTVVACIWCRLARSSGIGRCLRSNSLLLGVAFPCKTHVHQAWPVTRIDNRLYLEALLRLAGQ